MAIVSGVGIFCFGFGLTFYNGIFGLLTPQILDPDDLYGVSIHFRYPMIRCFCMVLRGFCVVFYSKCKHLFLINRSIIMIHMLFLFVPCSQILALRLN